jgi:hypothetical protein
MGQRGRPKRPIAEAREFGRLVELARKKSNRSEKLETLFFRVRRQDATRWGSFPKMWRLWAAFQADQVRHREAEHRLAQMERKIRQFEEASNRMAAKTAARIKQVEADFLQRNPRTAGWRESFDRQQKEFEAQINAALLKLPPQLRYLLRR